MGGARCSYRNCSVRSDGGKTHMFHYPVFDKHRCRQWLVNAQKLEFLDLSVSQLKNRVICQHHFTENSFMNCMYNKLKFDAVPTLFGPFCESNDENEKEAKEMLEIDLSHLLVEDIDNEVRLTIHEKQASTVLKYADFLTNNESDTFPKVRPLKKIPQETGSQDLATTLLKDNRFYDPQSLFSLSSKKNKKPDHMSNKKIEIEIEPKLEPTVQQPTTRETRSKNKVKILSETKITTAPDISARDMILVSPSTVINAKKSHPLDTVSVQEVQGASWANDIHNNLQPYQIIINNNIQNINDMPVVIVDENNKEYYFQNDNDNKQVTTTLPSNVESRIKIKSPVKRSDSPNVSKNLDSPEKKNKMPPERIAAIEEKRNFNKKLRDMIEFCLDELDDPEKVAKNKQIAASPVKSERPSLVEDNKPVENKLKMRKNNNCNVAQKSLLAKNNINHKEQESIQNVSSSDVMNVPVIQENNFASLEAKMAKMEQCLAKKIEHNTQQISELKEYVQSPEAMFSQTPTEHEEVYKKRLFKEISKFLSPDANSLVYEELFINKYGKNVPPTVEVQEPCTAKSAKRQKRR